jgi:hypothetical protein
MYPIEELLELSLQNRLEPVHGEARAVIGDP